MTKTISLLLIVVLILCGCNANEIESLNQELLEAQQEISNKNKIINELSDELETMRIQLDTINELAQKIQLRLEELESEKSIVKSISRKDRINTIIPYTQLQALKRIEINNLDFSTEGGTIDAYYYDSSLKYFIVWNYGEMGKRKIEYYLIDMDDIFVIETTWSYPEPFKVDNANINYQNYYIEKNIIYTTNNDLSIFNKSEENNVLEEYLKYREIIANNLP